MQPADVAGGYGVLSEIRITRSILGVSKPGESVAAVVVLLLEPVFPVGADVQVLE